MQAQYNLVADLGGTNIRFGLVELETTTVERICKYSINDYESLEHLVEVYLTDQDITASDVSQACVAIAGPIKNQTVQMTNCNWLIRATQLEDALTLERATLINDFEAIAHSVASLPPEGLLRIGDAPKDAMGPISVFGPGTGLGAALVLPQKEHHIVIPTEGGHAGLSARSDDEIMIFDYWRQKGCRVNREFFVCGNGILRIFEALCENVGSAEYKTLSVAEIQQRGCNGSNSLAERCMHIFCAFLGSAAGDQVLCTGSTGGLVLAGGILPKFPDFLQCSPFRERFESKGAMSDYTKAVPTSLIVEEQPGLIGAAAYLIG